MNYTDYKSVFEIKPCYDARIWLKTQPDLRIAWDNCERGDWLWWALMRMSNIEIPKYKSVAFAQNCKERAAAYVTAADVDAAYDVYVTAAAAAAADAAYSAADAAAAATDAAAADAATDAAYSAAYAAAAAADADATDADTDAYVVADAERKYQAEWIRDNFECPFD